MRWQGVGRNIRLLIMLNRKTWQSFNRTSSVSYSVNNSVNFKYFVFYRETYIEREKEESSNDRNDRAIRVACRFVFAQSSKIKCSSRYTRIVSLNFISLFDNVLNHLVLFVKSRRCQLQKDCLFLNSIDTSNYLW